MRHCLNILADYDAKKKRKKKKALFSQAIAHLWCCLVVIDPFKLEGTLPFYFYRDT